MTVKSFGEIKVLVKSLQVIVGSVSMHRTKIPRYNSETLIIVLSEVISVCQLSHAASPEQRTENAATYPGRSLKRQSFESKHHSHMMHWHRAAQCPTPPAVCMEEVSNEPWDTLFRLMTLSHLVSTGRTIFLAY